MTVLCNQLEAFALDLGDDQLRYLFTKYKELKSTQSLLKFGLYRNIFSHHCKVNIEVFRANDAVTRNAHLFQGSSVQWARQ